MNFTKHKALIDEAMKGFSEAARDMSEQLRKDLFYPCRKAEEFTPPIGVDPRPEFAFGDELGSVFVEQHLSDACQAQIADMSPHEREVTEMFVDKMMGEGRREYGPLDLASDSRTSVDLLAEAGDEGLDLLFYIFTAMRKMRMES